MEQHEDESEVFFEAPEQLVEESGVDIEASAAPGGATVKQVDKVELDDPDLAEQQVGESGGGDIELVTTSSGAVLQQSDEAGVEFEAAGQHVEVQGLDAAEQQIETSGGVDEKEAIASSGAVLQQMKPPRIDIEAAERQMDEREVDGDAEETTWSSGAANQLVEEPGYPGDDIRSPSPISPNVAETLDSLGEINLQKTKKKQVSELESLEEGTGAIDICERGKDLAVESQTEQIDSLAMTEDKHNLSDLEDQEGQTNEADMQSDSPAFDEAASDQVFDFVCCTCEASEKNVEAEHYCQECSECYCQTCLESHDRFPAFRNHTAIGQTEKARWCQITAGTSNVSLDKCGAHPTENVTMYCDEHQELCCHVCVALDHKACNTMKYIPELAVGIFTSKELDATRQSAATVTKDIEDVKCKRQASLIDLASSKMDVLAQLKTSRENLMTKYNALERKIVDEITKQNAHGSKTLQNDIAHCEKEVMDLEKSVALIDKSQCKAEAQMFIHMKRCEQRIKEAAKTLQDSLLEQHEFKIAFKPNTQLEAFLKTFESLGTIETVQASTAKANQTETQQTSANKRPKSDSDSSTNVSTSNTGLKTKNLKLLATKNRRSVTIKVKKDKSACWISGMCQIPGAGFIMADNMNNRLKYLSSSSLSVTESCDLSSAPRDVCCVSPQEVAVSMSNQIIQFFKVSSKLNLGNLFSGLSKTLEQSRSFKTDHQCYGIACFKDKIYVSDKGAMVVVYILNGQCLNVIEKDSLGVSMFSQTRHLAVSRDGARLHVADFEKGLVTVLLKNNTHVIATDDKVKGARGVCVSKAGRIFVTGKSSSNVMQVDPVGMVVSGIVDASMRVPGSVCVDKDDTMLVSVNPAAGSDNMNVVDLKLA